MAVDRDESQVDTFIASDIQRIHDVVFVVAGSQGRGQGTDKTVQQDIDIVIENVDALKYLFQVRGDAAAVIQSLVDTLHAFTFDDRLFGLRLFPVILVRDRFTNGEGQDGFTVKFGCIQIVLDEFEFLHELVFLEVRVEIVQGEGELFVNFRLVFVFRLDTVVVLMFNHFFDQFDCRIVFTGIFFFLWFYYDLGYFKSSRTERNHQSIVLLSRFEV